MRIGSSSPRPPLVAAAAAALALLVGLLVAVAPRQASASGAGHRAALTNFAPDGRQATRFDTAGNAVDAHDGAITEFGGSYYLYGTSYDCGYQWQNNDTFCGFTVYSSPDLTHWTDRGHVVPPRACQYCFRPHVVYDKRTRRYVMWVNDQSAADKFRVYTARRPTGPFTEQPVPDLPAGASCSADLDVFVDHDGAAYLTCSRANWHLAVIKLTPDYLRAAGPYTVVGVTRVEAPGMFERDGTYYLTMSDPNCGYCTGTGTSYLTASSPLGPWHGRDAWRVDGGHLSVTGGLYGLSAAGADWKDYTYSFDTAPEENATGTIAQSGFAVHMNSPDYGYLFLLNGAGDAPGHLQVLKRSGKTVESHTVTLDQPIRPGEWHHVSVHVAGVTMTTSVDGVQVDSYTDAANTYPAGGVGIREWNGAAMESALFDNVSVTDSSGGSLLSDDFSSADLGSWVAPTAGTSISTTSCGGQPAQVATLTGANGRPVQVYFSDLWDGHTNEALANYYWQPLSFASDGGIEPLTCGNSTVALRYVHQGHDLPVPAVDQSSGTAGFAPACLVTAGGGAVAQTFTAGRSGTLRRLAVTAYQDGTEQGRVLRHPPTAPLRVSVTDSTGGTLWSTSVDPSAIGWSARNLTLAPNIAVRRGGHYAVRLDTTSPQGCYGVQTSPLDPYSAGALSTAGGSDLKFFTTVAGGR